MRFVVPLILMAGLAAAEPEVKDRPIWAGAPDVFSTECPLSLAHRGKCPPYWLNNVPGRRANHLCTPMIGR